MNGSNGITRRRALTTISTAVAATALSGPAALAATSPGGLVGADDSAGPSSPDFQAAIQPVDPGVQIFGTEGWYTWCGAPIRGRDGAYYLFYSRWQEGSAGRGPDPSEKIFYGFSGWMKYSEIAVAVSPGPQGPYRHVRTVVQGTGDPGRWDRYNAHNPHIRYFQGRYYLYFIANNPANTPEPWFSKQPTLWLQYHAGQRIGVISARTLEDLIAGRGTRSDTPIAGPDYVNTFQMVVNPSVTEAPAVDGRPRFLMTYKTWNANGVYITVVGQSDRPEGPFPYTATALGTAETQAEDPYLWYDRADRRFYAIVKDFYKGADRTHALTPQYGALGMVTSTDGLTWKPAAHPVVSLRQLRLTDGTLITLGSLERPQLLFDHNGRPVTLHCAMARGSAAAGSQNVAIPLRWP
ncbi:glycoside hydrolase family protein [Streptomyces sp. NPDC057565]|uniref:glycoside hydrolase family protein n=1 Tax=Streptomyces sp. NPDC057565 TaxID=3346169 RepID=UPI00368E7061